MTANAASGLLAPPPAPRRAMSDLLDELLSRESRPQMPLAEIVSLLGDRSYGLLLLMMSLLCLVPGINMLMAIPLMLLGLQMLAGRHKPWFPAFVLKAEVPVQTVDRLIDRMLGPIRRVERLLKPRWHWTEAPLVDNLLGLLVVLLGVMILVPIPFSAPAPAAACCLIALGLTNRDGLVQVLGAVAGLVVMLVLGRAVLGVIALLA